jgi:prepilin-type N-terminal cleavage/methylation domain-containing protein
MFKKSSRGFTLVELIVVLSVITLLISIILTSLQSARNSARDRRTLSDISQIQLGLELYYNQNGHYPRPESRGPGEDYYCIGIAPEETCIFADQVKYGDPTLFSLKPKTKGENLLAALGSLIPRFIMSELPERTIGDDGIFHGYFYKVSTAEVIYPLTNTLISEPAGKKTLDPRTGTPPSGSGFETTCGNFFNIGTDSTSGSQAIYIWYPYSGCGPGWSPTGDPNAPINDPFGQPYWGLNECIYYTLTVQTDAGLCRYGVGCSVDNVDLDVCVEAYNASITPSQSETPSETEDPPPPPPPPSESESQSPSESETPPPPPSESESQSPSESETPPPPSESESQSPSESETPPPSVYCSNGEAAPGDDLLNCTPPEGESCPTYGDYSYFEGVCEYTGPQCGEHQTYEICFYGSGSE